MLRLLSIFLSCVLLLLFDCRESNKKDAYEIRERCGKSAAQWAKSKSGEIFNFRSHYNAEHNKCFILATLSPVVSNNFYTSFDILYDVDENKEYGHYTSRSYDNGTPNNHQCIIKGKYYGHNEQAEDKWQAFVKTVMEE